MAGFNVITEARIDLIASQIELMRSVKWIVAAGVAITSSIQAMPSCMV